MNYWTTRFNPGKLFPLEEGACLCEEISRKVWRTGQQAHGLDDLEDILNSPSPALGPTSFDPGHLPAADCSQQSASAADSTGPAAISKSGSAAANAVQRPSSATGSSLAVSSESAQPDLLLRGHRHAPGDAVEAQKASVWKTAYQSASAPLAAVWARIPEQLQRIPSLTVTYLTKQCKHILHSDCLTVTLALQASDVSSENQSTFRSQYLLDLMAKNKAATAAATVAGAAAGGAVAGPLGMAAGMVPLQLHIACYDLSKQCHSQSCQAFAMTL